VAESSRSSSSLASTTNAGTDHGRKDGARRWAPAARSEEASGRVARDGSSKVTDVGLPGCSAVSRALETANGCGSARCAERLDVPAGPPSRSAQSSGPRPGDHRACTTGKVWGSFVRSGFPADRRTAAASRAEVCRCGSRNGRRPRQM